MSSAASRRRVPRGVLTLGLLITLALTSARARATVVERIVAVVGERAILLSDLRERARPFALKVEAEVPPGAQRAAAMSQLYRMLVERMVDEELQLRAAARARLTVTSKEIDEAIQRVARQNRVSVEALLAETQRSGMNERQYREEVRRQLLEVKLINLRVQGRLKISEEDLRAAFRGLVLEERAKLRYRAAWILLPASADAAATLATAQRLSQQARGGADFAALARAHSSDAATRARGGDLGWLSAGKLPAPLERAAHALEVGEVSAPIRWGEQLAVLKVTERDETELPSYEEARDELAERVYMEKMAKARKSWVDGLRRRSYWEIRL